MSEEMESLHKNFIWELVPKPKDRKIIRSKWVYRKKESINEKESPTYKARLAAKGFSQKEGIDSDEILSGSQAYIYSSIVISCGTILLAQGYNHPVLEF